MVAPPVPINVQNAIKRFINGKLIANPEIARGPTPCPINTLSIILYREVSVIPIIAGMEYCRRSLPIFSVPSIWGLFCSDIEPIDYF